MGRSMIDSWDHEKVERVFSEFFFVFPWRANFAPLKSRRSATPFIIPRLRSVCFVGRAKECNSSYLIECRARQTQTSNKLQAIYYANHCCCTMTSEGHGDVKGKVLQGSYSNHQTPARRTECNGRCSIQRSRTSSYKYCAEFTSRAPF